MPVVMTPKGLLLVSAIMGTLEMALTVLVRISSVHILYARHSTVHPHTYLILFPQTMMNAYQIHAMLTPTVLTLKGPLSVNAILVILGMVSIVLVSMSFAAL